MRLSGSYIPFVKTRAERVTSGDPRPSIEELYGDLSGYAARVEKHAQAFVAMGYLLPEDVATYVSDARKHVESLTNN